MKRTKRRAFTLPELMVVVAVIALLLAIIMPFFERVFAVQRRTQCANNLEKIGQAYSTRGITQRVAGGELEALPVAKWPSVISGYVGGEQSLFRCPSDPNKNRSMKTAIMTLKEVYIEVFTGAAGNYATNQWNVPLDEDFSSQWIWRMNEQQFAEFSATSGHGKSYNYQGYIEGPDPYTYWFAFEDQGWKADGGDKDYWDLNLKIEYTDSAIKITSMPLPVGYNFNLCMGEGPAKQFLIEDVKNKPATTVEIEGGIGSSSYGMNSMANEIRATKKLLVLDYETIKAKGSDDEPELWDDWWNSEKRFPLEASGLPRFARHFNKANVLFADGTVKLMSIQDIDFADPQDGEAIRERYWNP